MSEALHELRRARFVEVASAAGLGALILGRSNNVMYVSGVPRVVVAGTRAFAPLAVLLVPSGDIYLHAASDFGLPPDISADRLYPQTWNPSKLVRSVSGLPGLGAVRRIGVDAMTPTMRGLLSDALPNAELVPVEETLRAVRRIKLDEEISRISAAIGLAHAGFETARSAISAGATELGVYAECRSTLAAHGATTVARDGSVCVLPADGRLRRLSDGRTIVEGELVAIDVAVVVDGYEGGLARTVPCGRNDSFGELGAEWRRRRAALVTACRPGNTGTAIRAAVPNDAQVPPPYDIGLGTEPPLAHDEVVQAGMVLSIQAFISRAGVGGYLGRDVVVVRPDGAELLTPDD